MLFLMVGLKSKAHHHLPFFLHLSKRSGNIGIWGKFNGKAVLATLNLLVCNGNWTEVCHSSTEYCGIGFLEALVANIVHFLTAFNINTVDVLMLATECHRPGDKIYFRPSSCTLLSQGESHLPTRIVSDEAHGVYLLVCRSRSDEYSAVFKVLFLSLKEIVKSLHNDLRILHASLSFKSAGKESACRLNDMVSVLAQDVEITSCGRMGIHVKIHSRSYEYRSLHREVCGDEHIVRHSVCHFSYCGCRTGGHKHCVSPQSQLHMAVPCAVAL